MKTIKTPNILQFLVTALLLLFINANMFAQKIDPTVSVSRDFDTNTENIHKSKLPILLNDSLYNFNLDFNYSIFNKKYTGLYKFSDTKSTEFTPHRQGYSPIFQAKLGYLSPLAPEGSIFFYPKFKNGFHFGIEANHSSFWGKLPLVGFEQSKSKVYDKYKVSARDMQNSISLNAGYSGKKNEFSIGGKFTSDYYSFYGANANKLATMKDFPNFLDSLSNHKYVKDNRSRRYNLFEFGVNFRSLKERGTRGRFNYFVDFYYSALNDKASIFPNNQINVKTNYFNFNGKFGPAVGRYADLLFGIELDYNNKISYTTNNYNSDDIFPNDKYCNLVNLSAEYRIQKNRWNMFVKFITSIQFSRFNNKGKYYFPFFLNANFNFEMIQGNLWWYGEIGGNNTINGYNTLLSINKWINPFAEMKTSSIPISFKTGFKGIAGNRLSYDIYVKYAIHKGLLQFINYYDSYYTYSEELGASFNTAYSNHNESAIGANIKWTSNIFTIGGQIEYRHYTKGKKGIMSQEYTFYGNTPWGYPPLEGKLYGEYNYKNKIIVNAHLLYRGNSKTLEPLKLNSTNIDVPIKEYEATINSFANFGIDVKYNINNNFAFFIGGNNLFNSHIQYFPQYIEKGAQFGGGILVKF